MPKRCKRGKPNHSFKKCVTVKKKYYQTGDFPVRSYSIGWARCSIWRQYVGIAKKYNITDLFMQTRLDSETTSLWLFEFCKILRVLRKVFNWLREYKPILILESIMENFQSGVNICALIKCIK